MLHAAPPQATLNLHPVPFVDLHIPRPVVFSQGVIACPFTAPLVHERQASAHPGLGIGDSVLLHLWEAFHSPAPPFRRLRVQPLANAPTWRARVLALPFVRNWQGERYAETVVEVRVSLSVGVASATPDSGAADDPDVRACVHVPMS